jgi:hypothetical protein
VIVGLDDSCGLDFLVQEGDVVRDQCYADNFFALPSDRSMTAIRVGLFIQTSDVGLLVHLVRSVAVEFRCDVTCRIFARLSASALLDLSQAEDEDKDEDIQSAILYGACRSIPIDEFEFRPRASFGARLDTPDNAVCTAVERACEFDLDFVCAVRPFVVLRDGGSEVAALFATVSAMGCAGCIHRGESGGCQRQPGPHAACGVQPERGPYR